MHEGARTGSGGGFAGVGPRTGSPPTPGPGARTSQTPRQTPRLEGFSRLVYERQGQLERLFGKILWVPGDPLSAGTPWSRGVWAFRRDLKPDGLLRALDGFSTDRAVLGQLERDLIDEVHYSYKGVLYAVTLERLRSKGIAWDKGGRAQIVLPRSYWTRRPDYPQERIPESRREIVVIT